MGMSGCPPRTLSISISSTLLFLKTSKPLIPESKFIQFCVSSYMLIVGEFVDLDLSLLSELSQSKELSEVVRQQFDFDPFSALAACWLRGSISETNCVTEGEVCFCRRFINGFLEGMSPLLIARQLRIGEKRSKERRSRFVTI